MNVDQPKDMVAKSHNVMSRTSLIGLSSRRLPPKPKNMDKHDKPLKAASLFTAHCPLALLQLAIANARPLSNNFATASFEVDSV
jgi:hypothetical protein